MSHLGQLKVAPTINVEAANRMHMSTLESPRSPRIIVAPFLEKLSTILRVEDASIITWSSSGTSFEIKDQERFTEIILPKYFRHNKFASFQRQLNYFGFKKMSKSKSETCTYYRPYFTRDNPENLKMIRRKTAQKSPRSMELRIPNAPSPTMKRCAVSSYEPPAKMLKMSSDVLKNDSLEADLVLDVLDYGLAFTSPMDDDLPLFDMALPPSTGLFTGADLPASCNGWFESLDNVQQPSTLKVMSALEESDIFKPFLPAPTEMSAVLPSEGDFFGAPSW